MVLDKELCIGSSWKQEVPSSHHVWVQLDRRPDPDYHTGHEGRRTQKRGSRKPLAVRGTSNHELALKPEEGRVKRWEMNEKEGQESVV